MTPPRIVMISSHHTHAKTSLSICHQSERLTCTTYTCSCIPLLRKELREAKTPTDEGGRARRRRTGKKELIPVYRVRARRTPSARTEVRQRWAGSPAEPKAAHSPCRTEGPPNRAFWVSSRSKLHG